MSAATAKPENLVFYLTNALGEHTGYGDLPDFDLDKIPFEDGPGHVLPYIALVGGVKCVLGNLEVAYQDEFWGDEPGRFQPKAHVREYCHFAMNDISSWLTAPALLLPLDESMPGRFVISIAIPLDNLADRQATTKALTEAFGRYADLPVLEQHAFLLAPKTACWEISTAHICEKANDWLVERMNRFTQDDLIGCYVDIMSYAPGYVIKLIAAPWDDAGLANDGITVEGVRKAQLEVGMPESLIRLLHLAASAGGRYLVLDPDAEQVEGLPVYDW